MRADDRRGGEVQGIQVDMADLRQLYRGVAAADRVIAREMRRAMLASAAPMVRDVQLGIRLIPSSGKYRSGVREALVRGTSAKVTSTGRTTGIRIVTSGKFLPESKQPLVRAMNTERWRHPVFANPDHVRNYRTKAVRALAWARGVAPASIESWRWVEQKGRPYFGAVAYSHLPKVRAGVVEAIESAAHAVAAKKGRA